MPEPPWPFHAATEVRGYQAFTHGLGYGDVDGDGRSDILEATGWYSQPPSLEGDPLWPRHDQRFRAGGAQIPVVDVDGDGDVVTTIAAHGYGLAW